LVQRHGFRRQVPWSGKQLNFDYFEDFLNCCLIILNFLLSMKINQYQHSSFKKRNFIFL
jgi:hypothetical protein